MNELLHTTHTTRAARLPAHHASRIAIEHGAFISAERHDSRGVDQASKLLIHLFRSYGGCVAVRLWDGTSLNVGRAAPNHAQVTPSFTLFFRTPEVVSLLVLGRDRLRLADAYFRGDMDIEGDFFAALSLKDHLDTICMSLPDRIRTLWAALRLRMLSDKSADNGRDMLTLEAGFVAAHSKVENRKAIAFHYDVSNDFYALWLDDSMVYSCAYFEQSNVTLEQAQWSKLDHICRKLMLKWGDRFLDVGCGWGALIIHAAQHYGVYAHGITLSQQQLELARTRISLAGLDDRVSVELRDYRDLEGECVYDKVASVGMFEHVGLKNLPVYFSTIHRLLKPSGLFLNHGITHDVEGWEETSSTEFINRYVFPDGQLDTVGNIQRRMETARFEIADVEALRPHYALTLRHWVSRLESHHAQALNYVDESTYRVWRLYMAACALEFESGEIGVYQVLGCKRGVGSSALPLTRRHLYPTFKNRARDGAAETARKI